MLKRFYITLLLDTSALGGVLLRTADKCDKKHGSRELSYIIVDVAELCCFYASTKVVSRNDQCCYSNSGGKLQNIIA